jgi:uncharacterized protein (DUF433 family)
MPVQKPQSVATVETLEEKLLRLKELAQTAPPITINPQRMSGTPVIGIQRMPVVQMIDYLLDGYSLDEFIEEFGIDPVKARGALEKIRAALDEGWLAEPVDY